VGVIIFIYLRFIHLKKDTQKGKNTAKKNILLKSKNLKNIYKKFKKYKIKIVLTK
jgi:hypothetical protein